MNDDYCMKPTGDFHRCYGGVHDIACLEQSLALARSFIEQLAKRVRVLEVERDVLHEANYVKTRMLREAKDLLAERDRRIEALERPPECATIDATAAELAQRSAD